MRSRRRTRRWRFRIGWQQRGLCAIKITDHDVRKVPLTVPAQRSPFITLYSRSVIKL